ncbi:MAG: non-canonical purine NTP pyrophosphatase [Acidobacteriota bacterium]
MPDFSRLPDFVLVTGNDNKRRETERILGRSVAIEPLDLPEIQSGEVEEVLREKGREAYRRLQRPVVVEETALALSSMNGFPGPLVKWMLDAIQAEGIARAAIALGDPRATALCALLYVDGETSVMAVGETRGDLTLPPRGDHGFGWDPVFQPEGSELSYAQLGLAVKDEIGHRGRAWAAFAERF